MGYPRLFEIIRNAARLAALGEWREFNFRLRILLGQIDLDFSSQADLNLPEEKCYDYADSGGLHLERILRDLDITSDDAIIDIGSGKGGALFTFSKYPFGRIAGCEISAELIETARKNLAVMKVDNVELIMRDAVEFRELDDFNYIYFFNPFPGTVMREVIDNIVASLQRRPRRVTIIYFNPECHEVIVNETPFVKLKEYQQNALKYYLYSNPEQASA